MSERVRGRHGARAAVLQLLLSLVLASCDDASSDGEVGADPIAQGSAAAREPNAGVPGSALPVARMNGNDAAVAAAAPAAPRGRTDVRADAGALGAADCGERVVAAQAPCSDDPDPCGLRSGWPGDAYCLKPPPAAEGIQIHFGPKRYDDPSETDKYAAEAGAETFHSVLAHVPIDSDRYFDRVTVQARPGVRYWYSTEVPEQLEERYYVEVGCGQPSRTDAFGGGTTLIYDYPPGGVAAPENQGIGFRLGANSSVCLDVLFQNTTDAPQLREFWVNLYFTEPSRVTESMTRIVVLGGQGLTLPPGRQLTQSYSARFSQPGRILQLASSRRQWTTRFSAWLNDRLVYDSHDFEAQARFAYDSITVNPPIDPAGATDGAVSGILSFSANDVLRFECVVDNTSDTTLVYSNYTSGEQCNIFGFTVGGGLSGSFR